VRSTAARLVVSVVLVQLGCAGNGGADRDGGGGGSDGGGNDVDAGPVIEPPPSCDVPDEGKPVDTSVPTTVVGNGSPASCTTAALQNAVDQGGIVTFDCGTDPFTLALTAPIVINNVAGADGQGDTVIDGGDLITLSGEDSHRILYLNACEPPYNNSRCDIWPHPHLTVQNLVFVNGRDDSANGGGAIYRHGGALTVIHSSFFDNHGAMLGQDTAGGAIRLEQATPALIVDSVFGAPGRGNSCSDGGAIGSLQASPVTIINTVIDSNRATGENGNPGNGGNGGGIYHDGVDLDLTLCGVQLTHSAGNAFGGGLFLVDNAGRGRVSITNSEISDNMIPEHAPQPSHGGAAYLQGAIVTITNTTVADDSASFAAGLYVNGMNGMGSLDATNLTVTGMPGDGFTIESSIAGTLLNSTIAGNGRGIAGAGTMTLVNTLVAGNTTNCQGQPSDGGGNLQFPGTSCGGIATADPLLGPLQDNGGTTGVRTMAPGGGSPALGAGNGCPSTDARGEARPGDGCTSGAHQAD